MDWRLKIVDCENVETLKSRNAETKGNEAIAVSRFDEGDRGEVGAYEQVNKKRAERFARMALFGDW